MTHPEQSSHDQSDVIAGKYTAIRIDNQTDWKDFLGKDNVTRQITLSNEDLPGDIQDAVFYYNRDTSDDPITISTTVRFKPDFIPESQQEGWEQDIIRRLLMRLDAEGVKTDQLPHETNSLYVQLSDTHVIHLQAIAETNSCIIVSAFEKADDFYAASHLAPIDADEIEAFSANDVYTTLQTCLRVWSHTFDACIDTYGESTEQPSRLAITQLNLTLPEEADVATEGVNELAPSKNYYTFDDIAGYDDVKEKMRELALLVRYSEIASDIGLTQMDGMLLYGEPGTGKTHLCQAFAHEINAELITLSVSDIVEKWIGESARNVDKFFMDIATRQDLVVVFMDEFDSLGNGDSSTDTERTDVVNRLKAWITTISEEHHNIILLGATNHLDRVDPALVRPGRFTPIEIRSPDQQLRRQIWQKKLGQAAAKALDVSFSKPDAVVLDVDEEHIDLDKLANASTGMVGSHMTKILNTIRLQRLREYVATGEMPAITEIDILNEIKAYPPSQGDF